MDVTGPYLEGPGSPFIQMNQLKDAEEARRMVAFWADQGVTSFKAYMNITRAQLKAAIDEVHRRGLKITGHLCSVTYPEAAALGIDNLEHGFWANSQNDPGKQPDRCPPTTGAPTLAGMDSNSPEARALIGQLVRARVAITSTLPVFEPSSPSFRPLSARMLEMLSSQARADYLTLRRLAAAAPAERRAARARLWANELKMERAFVAAGGLLIAGPDPTGAGNVLPGFGDQRAIELLVAAGFAPLEAIRIGTHNGATYLGLADRIGSIAVGKHADLILVQGDPSRNIEDIENVEIVFKDGVGYDSAALLASVKGRYGQY
jgi:imidazolonepropionase-like amidohydrolase